MDLDNIIIGSGAGGLSVAICLARAGQKVLVLEQHDVPGGWCHSFYLGGHRFSPGVHYIGKLSEGQSTNALYKGLGIANDLVFFTMNPDGYEHCIIGKERIDIPADFDELYQVLAERFPEEKKGIRKYLTTVRNVSSQLALIPKMNGFWDNITIPWRTRHLGKYGLFSLKTVIDWHIKNPLLKQILNIQCGDHGLPPGKASFPYHCAVMDHYSNGGFYPMGGGGAIVKAMTNALKKHGGELRTSQKVKRILLDEGKTKRAIGVELESGEKIYAKRVISNNDPGKTYLELVGRSHLSAKLRKQVAETKYSRASLMLFLTVDMDLRQAGLDSGNFWLKTEKDSDLNFAQQPTADITSDEEFSELFISCTTLKDPTSFDGRHHTLEVITFIDHKSFDQFKNEGNKHSPEYASFKELLTEKLIKGIEKVVPGIGSRIVQKELGTPMTNMFYIDSTDGCVYGTEKSFWQIGAFAFKTKSEIENLYLCGASILANGVAGATYSGVQTAAKILNCSQDDLLKDSPDQNLRIYSAENVSGYPEWMKKKIQAKTKRGAALL
ncbi:phytoene desaturase family protein [Dyadobacter psychrotolerans]|uniref:NAD(P)/FAD-dependent oxidoreductase n=1 Tax=Dyadobacter psychrotolerans TaxID=2541721 RepID=A0A4R5DF55_9BACT|nr:NAD(P)/FAD-dependent oxidoreductase [Dyadobacter psychrotolerans]TDE10570.1 NAD(P)/FAD-dependent oxidoreductase [Dyadobacter psychrotolerans]